MPRAFLLVATTSVACASTVTPSARFEDAASSRDALLDERFADATATEDRPRDVAPVDAIDESTPDSPPGRCDLDRSFAPVDAPRLVAPLSTFEVSTAQPTLRWNLPADVSTARIEIFRDPLCTQLEWTADVRGSSVRVAPALPRGPHFWRATSHCVGGSSAPSNVTWAFVLPSHVADGDCASRPSRDVDRNGSSDAVLAAEGHPTVYSFATETFGAIALAPLRGPGDAALDVEGPGAFGDFDRDGWVDLATSPSGLDAARSFYVFHASGGGVYEPATTVPFEPLMLHTDALRLAPTAVADFDGDGYADVVSTSRDSTTAASRFVVFRGSAEGLRPAPIADLRMGGGEHAPVWNLAGAGDVDLDGHADLVLVGGGDTSAVRVFRGTDAGLDAPQTVWLRGHVSYSNASTTADFDADGHLDVATLFEPFGDASRIVIFRGHSAGFATTEDLAIPPRHGRWFVGGASAADVDGDGYPDLLAIDSDPHVGGIELLVYRGSRDGPAMTPSSVSTEWLPPDCRWGAGAPLRDLDGDGRIDRLVFCDDANPATRTRLYVSRGRSDASFAPFVLAASWEVPITSAF